MSKAPFEALKKVLQEMTPAYREKLLGAHHEFTRLKSYCQAKGYIEILPQLKGIRVLKSKKEVKELKKVIDILKPGNFKWEDKNEIQPVKAKARKKARQKTKARRNMPSQRSQSGKRRGG